MNTLKIETTSEGIVFSTPKMGRKQMVTSGSDSDYDYYTTPTGAGYGKRLGIPVAYLSWLPGTIEIPFDEIKRDQV